MIIDSDINWFSTEKKLSRMGLSVTGSSRGEAAGMLEKQASDVVCRLTIHLLKLVEAKLLSWHLLAILWTSDNEKRES